MCDLTCYDEYTLCATGFEMKLEIMHHLHEFFNNFLFSYKIIISGEKRFVWSCLHKYESSIEKRTLRISSS